MFEKIISSFSGENIEDALPKENLKVADIKTPDEKNSFNTIWVAIFVAILVVIIAVRKKRKK